MKTNDFTIIDLFCAAAAAVSLIFFLILNVASAAEATKENTLRQPNTTAGPSTVLEITAEAKLPIKPDDSIDDAKEAAILKAKDNVLLKAAALFVGQQTLIREKNKVLNILRPKMDNIIEETKVISAQQTNEAYYRARITVKVNRGLVEKLLAQDLFENKAVMLITETCDRRIPVSNTLHRDLTETLRSRGYAVVNPSTKNNTVAGLASAARRGSADAIRRLGMYFLADVVVIGSLETSFSERTQDIYSAHARSSLKIFKIGRQKELRHAPSIDIKGFGANEEKACVNAVKKASIIFGDEVAKALPQVQSKNVTIKLREIANYSSQKKAKELILSIPHVRGAKSGTGTDYVAEQILKFKKFAGESTILLEARKLN